MTSPIVECSPITFCVPISAARSKGISPSTHGVRTMRSASPSCVPSAPSTRYPTLSIRRSLTRFSEGSVTSTASLGTNAGCVVMIVRPEPLCGSSSCALARMCAFSMPGITSFSMNFVMKVDLPVLTGPTMPIYTSPCVLSEISLYRS